MSLVILEGGSETHLYFGECNYAHQCLHETVLAFTSASGAVMSTTTYPHTVVQYRDGQPYNIIQLARTARLWRDYLSPHACEAAGCDFAIVGQTGEWDQPTPGEKMNEQTAEEALVRAHEVAKLALKHRYNTRNYALFAQADADASDDTPSGINKIYLPLEWSKHEYITITVEPKQ